MTDEGENALGSGAFGPNDPMTLSEAAKFLLRGLVTASTLKAAIQRGDLKAQRLGRCLVTTPAMIDEWRGKCRVPAKIDQSTESGASQLAATRAMLETLAKRSSKKGKTAAR